jgi:uncharacterized protein
MTARLENMQFRRLKRREFLSRFMIGASALGVIAGIDGLFWEPKNLVAERVTVRLKRLPEEFDGFRIAQLSDFHFGPYMGRAGVERAVRLGETFKPDIVVLTGDFVSHPFRKPNGRAGARHAEPCADVLATIKAPTFAILGNHDHWNDADIVHEVLKERGVNVLRNQMMPVERGQSRIWVSGVDDVYVGAADLPRALRGIPPSETTILLAHEPDFADHAARFPVDLQLSGHSHGGQVRVPGLGALVLPPMAEKYPVGLNQVGGLQVYTNRGVGVINPPVRLNCPPEVTFLTLARAVSV